MKKYLSNIIIFLSLFGIIWVVLNISVRKKGDYVLQFKPSQVAAVSVQHDGKTVQMEMQSGSDGSTWVVSDGRQRAVADERAVQTYLAFLARITVVERFSAEDFPDAASRERLGLGSLAQIALTLKSGKTLDLQLGHQTPSGTEIYAAASSDPKTVFTISNGFEKKLLADYMGLRSRQVFPIKDLRSIEITYADAPVTVASENSALLKALRAIVYNNYFPAVSESDIGAYGLTVPDVTISLSDEGGSKQIYSIAKYGGRFFLRQNAAGPQDVLVLSSQSVDDLLKVLKELIVHRRAG